MFLKMNPENLSIRFLSQVLKTWSAEAVVSDRVINIESKRKIFAIYHSTDKYKCCKDKDEMITQADLY